MMTKEFQINQLATAVMWWLSYISAIGRNYVLSEGSIRFPVSEYLERSKIDEIQLEYEHPKLSRKRFDLFFFKRKLDEKTVFEFKYIKNGSTRNQEEKQRIFDDLMRLHLFAEKNHKAYFMICGNQGDFIKDFQTILSRPKDTDGSLYIKPKDKSSLPITIKPEGFYSEWFSFDQANADKEIDLKTTKPEYIEIYETFFQDYFDSHKMKTRTDLGRPDKIKTKLVFLSDDFGHPIELFQPSKIGIWEVITP